ncbi:hypothetical protein UCRPC4_g06967 [Phaeomoniella chlamydospora]|uniref:Aromatic prenyltransferase n=1 Tax=Phaeomoniella chlamydospora TaxID=158046 RepID=A0A0G2DTD9_PHACM|nr:hypothetical protein UCRPC4_g06967 [Phaeomoniella chlamydospora]
MQIKQQVSFNPSRFFEDVQNTCTAINAPYSESATQGVIEAYSNSFHTGAVLWRTTDRPGDALNYRFYERKPTDTVSRAVEAGLLKPDHHLGQLITSWSSLYSGTPEQSCDFDAERGLTKAWVYMGGMRPVDDILNAPHVPESIRRHGPTFHSLGLELVRHVAADYLSETLNIYFRAPGPINLQQAITYIRLADVTLNISADEVEEMRQFLNPTGFTFSVTMAYTTGEIQRVAFYALKLHPGKYPVINDRLKVFFSEAPSYDEEEMNAIAWSFGKGGKKYIKAERSYCGELVPLMKDWSSAMSS